MSRVNCPYCHYVTNKIFDKEWPNQGATVEVECIHCKKIFHATAQIELSLSNERIMPCKNGEYHVYQSIYRRPLIINRGKLPVKCIYCGLDKEVPAAEGIHYGYTKEEIQKGLSYWEDLLGDH